MRTTIKTINIVKDPTVWPQETSHTKTLKTIYYDNETEMQQALKEMPDYECWDEANKCFCSSLK